MVLTIRTLKDVNKYKKSNNFIVIPTHGPKFPGISKKKRKLSYKVLLLPSNKLIDESILPINFSDVTLRKLFFVRSKSCFVFVFSFFETIFGLNIVSSTSNKCSYTSDGEICQTLMNLEEKVHFLELMWDISCFNVRCNYLL